MHEPKYEVPGSKFRKPRTLDLEPSSVSPVPLFPFAFHPELRTQNSELLCSSPVGWSEQGSDFHVAVLA